MYIGWNENQNIVVQDEDALQYAMERCGVIRPLSVGETPDTKEFDEMLVEWFYSGNWIHEESGESA